MNVPVESRAGVEFWIGGGEEIARETRGDVVAYAVICQGCEENFVDMQREGL